MTIIRNLPEIYQRGKIIKAFYNYRAINSWSVNVCNSFYFIYLSVLSLLRVPIKRTNAKDN